MDLFQNLEIINSKVERVKDNATTCKKVKLELDTLLIIFIFLPFSSLSLSNYFNFLYPYTLKRYIV